MKLEFKEWVAQEWGSGAWSVAKRALPALKGAIPALTDIAFNAANLPDPKEVGLNTHGVGDAANAAFSLTKGAYDWFTALTPKQIKAAKAGCYYKRSLDSCELLCKKTNDKQACRRVQAIPQVP